MTKDKIVQEITGTGNLVRWDIANLGLSEMDFSKVNLNKASFTNCRLAHSSFAGANLRDATFIRCRFKNNNFDGADSRGARFAQCTGLTPEAIAALEQAGALVENPRNAMTPVIGIVAVLLVAAVLFFLAGGRELLPQRQAGTATPIAASPAELDFEQWNERVLQLETQEKYAEAVAGLNTMIALKPADIDLYLRYLQLLIAAERYDEVAGVFEKLLSFQPSSELKILARLLLAESLLRKGDKENGMIIYEKLLQNHAEDIQNRRSILMQQGTVLWKIGDTGGALSVFKALLKISGPEQAAGVLINIALVHRDAGNQAAEIAAIKKAMNDRQAPKEVRAGAKIHLALIDLAKGQIEKAKKMILQAGAEGGDPGQVLDGLHRVAEQLVTNNDLAEAVLVYEAAIELLTDNRPTLCHARVHLANLLTKMKQPEKALALYRLVAAESPDPAQKKWAEETVREIESQTLVDSR